MGLQVLGSGLEWRNRQGWTSLTLCFSHSLRIKSELTLENREEITGSESPTHCPPLLLQKSSRDILVDETIQQYGRTVW